MSTVERPLRRDAERNRQRILAAARELFAERGLAVTLDDVADRAGLGVGTVYRRFSCRDQLVDALFEEQMVEILALVDASLEIEDPWLGLQTFLERLVALQAADRGLKEALLGTTEGRERVARVREQMRPRVTALVERAQAAGQLRDDLSASDFALLQIMVGTVVDVATPARPELWRRFLTLMLDGMRADGRRTPLVEPPLEIEALDECMCRWRPGRSRG